MKRLDSLSDECGAGVDHVSDLGSQISPGAANNKTYQQI
jgi:hypothetical protein